MQFLIWRFGVQLPNCQIVCIANIPAFTEQHVHCTLIIYYNSYTTLPHEHFKIAYSWIYFQNLYIVTSESSFFFLFLTVQQTCVTTSLKTQVAMGA